MFDHQPPISRRMAVKALRSKRCDIPEGVQLNLTASSNARPKVHMTEGGALALAYSVSRWTNLGDEIEEGFGPCVRERQLEGSLLSSGQAVGYVLFHEYDVSALVSDFEFWTACDNHSLSATRLAEASLSGWPISIAETGLIVEFSRLWVDPRHARGSAWAAPVRQLFENRWALRGRTQCALLLLKPYPLEFEGNRDLNPRVHAARLAKRSNAMRRLYTRELGVQPIRRGTWMWRSFENRTGEPAVKGRRWLKRAD